MASNMAEETIPMTIYDNKHGIEYKRGKFLGKGGFAKCYELIPTKGDGTVYAGKIMSRTLLQKSQQKEKLKLEIKLHRELEEHKNVVKFISVFEDDNFVYIVLELCKCKSMMELHKRRKAITEPETRFFVRQILEGIVHLHERRIVHRDLKLGNLFLDSNLIVKIGDFGLATNVRDGDKKHTICGTPNYIAPEVLLKKGHSYEVDIWAVGCILYTLLVGKPPFETQTLKETYSRIKNNHYTFPPSINPYAKNLIEQLLKDSPVARPTAKSVLNHPFFKNGLTPRHLPPSCLTMTPRFDRRSTIHPVQQNRPALTELRPQQGTASSYANPTESYAETHNYMRYVESLVKSISEIERSYAGPKVPGSREISHDIESPELTPFHWISKWVDYSDKYGLSYQLCDGSSGVLFNDVSRVVLYADNETVQYIEANNTENFYTLEVFPSSCMKKMTLLKYFRTYMNENLVQTGHQTRVPETDVYSRLPFLYKWFRAQHAIVFLLNNGIVQMNFFTCHSKLIFCPVMQAISYIDPDKNLHTMSFKDLKHIQYPEFLHSLFSQAKRAMSTLQETLRVPGPQQSN